MIKKYMIVIKAFDNKKDAEKVLSLIGRVLDDPDLLRLSPSIEEYNPDAIPV